MRPIMKPISLLMLLALLLSFCACAPADLETLAQVVGEVADQMEQGTASDSALVGDTENTVLEEEISVEVAPEEETPEAESTAIYGEDYYTPEDVALYLHLYQELPPNYLTKAEARDWGWENSEGNLWDVFPGGCIGGDRFGNYEGLLPDGDWTECDVNYEGGYRNAERLVFNKDGAIYYTNDHYESFTQLYEGWAS